MPKTIFLPELAESIVEAEIQRWLVAEGDPVEEGQPIVEVLTDKATVELPAPAGGVIGKLLAREGEVVRVHAAIALLVEPGEQADTPGPQADAPGTSTGDGSLFKPSEHQETIRNPFSGDVGSSRFGERARHRFPPPVRYQTPPGYEDRETRVPLRGVRRAIAQQMTASHLHAVRTLVVDEADLTELRATRDRLRPRAEQLGTKLTYLPFVFRAVARALDDFPMLNSSLDERAQEIVLKRYCNIGLAVATEPGLMVPVVRDVRDKTLGALAVEIESLATRARAGELAPEELRGSTFTVTSIGNVGTLFTFPIINVPDAAILGVHTARRRPVIVEEAGEEKIVARDMVYLSLSFDHRLADGAQAAAFLRRVIELLEHPDRLDPDDPREFER